MGNLLLVFGLALLDVFTVNAPARLAAWAGRLAGDSVGGVFALGATSGLVAAPCGAPAFAVVLTFVSTTRSAALGFLYLFVFSIGLTALLIAVGLLVASWALLAVLARRLPPGAAKDLATVLPACLTTARRLRPSASAMVA
jgi:thiol:disulfide interchange protein DsbD